MNALDPKSVRGAKDRTYIIQAANIIKNDRYRELFRPDEFVRAQTVQFFQAKLFHWQISFIQIYISRINSSILYAFTSGQKCLHLYADITDLGGCHLVDAITKLYAVASPKAPNQLDIVEGVLLTSGVVIGSDDKIVRVPTNSKREIDTTAGEIVDLEGRPIEAFVGSITIDTTPPRVMESSIVEGDVVPIGTLTYVARLSKPLDDRLLSRSDVELRGQISGLHGPTRFDYQRDGINSTSMLTVEFAELPESLPYGEPAVCGSPVATR